MSDLANQKRMAAAVLKCGINRVWFDPERQADIEAAISRDDLRELIEEGAIKARTVKGNSRGRARERMAKRAYGHQRGPGRRKGAAGARASSKRTWIGKIRAQRRALREMRDEGTIDRTLYRLMYRRASGGQFRSVAHLTAHVETMAGRMK
ncbi:50S ribosomal protein L19e [Methanoculleus bourgensis]|uniref:Large ribosomal subunit protein eL19 n=1 Tax=Methanoculleus bourgensis TaxID=83986 RepID=A0A0X3BPH6_9EURY|nr:MULTISPECIES: 50S ribosomal protein L19e [Methanoculleus]MBT0732175.1 50S ribosomal protein L19e [Methanoculleus bourgensis]MDD3373017.1 50S ribosomal protein L19e [Methanoculleus bourgensis]NMA88030.1 50S ribosomal protein L19e [Methanoculleus bourgensis]NQS77247.1 50S ribosomal protein L19e [Methanoculleus bourgensis]CVK33395.1 50S ribosomal protein L19e [Methanoculleus bourgensis]